MSSKVMLIKYMDSTRRVRLESCAICRKHTFYCRARCIQSDDVISKWPETQAQTTFWCCVQKSLYLSIAESFWTNWWRFKQPVTPRWHLCVIFWPAEGFNMVGGGFSLKYRFSSSCFRKLHIRQVETFRRTSIGMCMIYLESMGAKWQLKSKNGFPVVENEGSEKPND